ncbi:cbb3-type cytochrome c oxidase subunit 3 [Pleionea sp. CnH1-48]|uniref:cbb3-type cytochrome oxidase subunit 3 n=1 Tax=Pleionea sp. CnH1-48 TaxID=2954494 RepID=UPI0020980183|nr:cbb3-type cytochrome c oxidase subunit 3 [Pleionea sp. CnH1-48]MCO7223936.1 cbb3-type cytochrome c oxidase subunit 3 [Pleionea sp. CnH1-48]
MDMNLLRGILTAVLLVLFIGLVLWAYSKKRKSVFDEASQLPFVGDEHSDRIVVSKDNNSDTAEKH